MPAPAVGDARRRMLGALNAVLRLSRSPHAALAEALRGVEPGPDRALITDLLYTTLRWLPALDAALAPHLPRPESLPSPVRDVLRAGAADRLVRGTAAHAAVHAWVEVIKRARGPEQRLAPLVNALLRRVSLAGLSGAAALALSEELHAHLREAQGERTERVARAMLQPGPLWLTGYAPDVREHLEAAGALVRSGPLPNSYAVQYRGPLEGLAPFAAGSVQPQNPASAAVVAALGEVRGERVLDVGSGHGIKAAQLAAAGAEVLAVDADGGRIAAGRANLARLGFTVTHLQRDATQSLHDLPEVGVALLDAPCSGTGTLRGHPEIKLRWRADESERAARDQAKMLAAVAERVRVGGRLVYAVCALGLAEGPAVVADFLARHPDWRPAPLTLPLPTHAASVGGWILPDDAGLDGFYLAPLQRDR
jgi:16S rRNA (cytosine967-C5)-methyltransferase